MEEVTNSLKEISFNSNSKLREKILGPHPNKMNNKENEDVFNKIWSWYRTGLEHNDEHDISHNMSRIEETDENINWDQWYNNRLSVSARKQQNNEHSFCSATYDTNNSFQHVAPWFGSEDPPGRDTLLFKCREAIESLQDEIEDHQKALNERDYLLSQANEKEEQLAKSKQSALNEVQNLRDKLNKLQNEMKDNEEHYEQECHKLIEENKKLKLENIEQESKISKYKIRLESIEESINELKHKKQNLENSNEKLEVKIKDLKATITEYESANQQLDTKLIWAEKTYEEGVNKIMTEYEKKEQILQRQNQELLEKSNNERLEREAKIKTEMKDKIMGIQKGIEASNEEIKRLREDKQKLLEENMRLTENIAELKISNSRSINDESIRQAQKCSQCHNCEHNEGRKYIDPEMEYELKQRMRENQSLHNKNRKLEKHLDSLRTQIKDLKSELVDLKTKKKEKMQKVKEEADKYKEYFRSQIDALRNEMVSKKSNMDKMKMLIDHYKVKVCQLEQELTEAHEKWGRR